MHVKARQGTSGLAYPQQVTRACSNEREHGRRGCQYVHTVYVHSIGIVLLSCSVPGSWAQLQQPTAAPQKPTCSVVIAIYWSPGYCRGRVFQLGIRPTSHRVSPAGGLSALVKIPGNTGASHSFIRLAACSRTRDWGFGVFVGYNHGPWLLLMGQIYECGRRIHSIRPSLLP
jgi:hypothetical protein